MAKDGLRDNAKHEKHIGFTLLVTSGGKLTSKSLNAAPAAFACVSRAWRAHRSELLQFLTHRTHQPMLAEDLLQEAFLKAMRAGAVFCALENPRAWLFQVARNALIDAYRREKPHDELPDDLAMPSAEDRAPVDQLDGCLLYRLSERPPADRAIIQACDIQGQTVREFSQTQGLSLAAAKSRLLRARSRLRADLIAHCGICFSEDGTVCCHGVSNSIASSCCPRA
ncbi:MAG TPA: sigma-70 family RNA polymerase sigma factor [Halothiobacillus sp.]|nr:sigma-70 family RNA polymerase sigma factor [Halothiobacillus sp.]